MESSIEKSERLAEVIEILKPFIPMIDREYAKLIIASLYNQASTNENAQIFNPSFDNKRTDRLIYQAKALQGLVDFIEFMIKSNDVKSIIDQNKINRDKINSLFL